MTLSASCHHTAVIPQSFTSSPENRRSCRQSHAFECLALIVSLLLRDFPTLLVHKLQVNRLSRGVSVSHEFHVSSLLALQHVQLVAIQSRPTRDGYQQLMGLIELPSTILLPNRCAARMGPHEPRFCSLVQRLFPYLRSCSS